VLAAVTATGYTIPTPIQEQAIPHVLARRDVLGIAQTGTGKTAAFVLPMLTLLEKGRARARMPRTLILEPTRELAAQVKENFDRYGAGQKLNVALLIGGVSFGDQDIKLTRGVDVLIATPGRLLDHTERGGLLLTGVELLVIDEADRMLDMGFIPDIERICKLVPFTRQTLFFTATMPPEIRRITEAFLHNPVKVEVSKPATAAVTVTQSQVPSGREAHQKRDVLRRLLRDAKDLKNAIIFCNRKRDVAILYKSLQKHGFSVGALHGDMDQPARMAALDQFRKGELPLLVASDVAARGLDIPEVSHVFNFDVPPDQKSVVAIEKLIGQAIPKADGDFAPSADASDHDEPREKRTRGRSQRDRKPRSEREAKPRGEREAKPRSEGEDRPRSEREARPRSEREARPRSEREARPRSEREGRPRSEGEDKPANGGRKNGAKPQVPAQVPSFGRAEPRRVAREADTEPGDHSHLPAFLLRPVRA
jgi:superfamily II DNA/RNA helicase